METALNITVEEVQDIAYEAEVDLTVHEDYSGRGMFGKTCFGVSGSMQSINAFLLHLAYSAGVAEGRGYENSPERDLFDELKLWSMHTDSMGYDTIAYWPQVQIQS